LNFSFVSLEFGSELYQQALVLREQVLRLPLGLTLSAEDKADEDKQLHFALLHQGQVAACVSFKILEQQQLKLRQMAVMPDFQGQGLGKKLILLAEKYAAQLGYLAIHMAARDVAQNFYRKLGYVSQGSYFTEVGIQHIHMSKTLS